MNIENLKKLRDKLRREIFGFASVKTDKAVLVYDTDELAVGVEVFIEDENGERTRPEDGEYRLDDSSRIRIEDGKIAELLEREEDFEPTPPSGDYVTREEYNAMKLEINELYKLVDGLANKVGVSRRELDERMAKVEKMAAAQTPKEDLKNKPQYTPTSATASRELEAASKLFNK